ncbi:uncharacterized protein EKO05_0003952 [Ascochyta rabiei]|uniref:N-acetylgalactosaminide beta-1,3-galactosyltransferase n=1 Tax=Didymella rabiei TaxID=5454 RepID=A0A163DY89_DIDRA|nr:uncharacterized protein EKO05_0003952 [Ascochyta rabiei]KZM23412.1 transferase [Ascochyta rabiei]UPX13444.1 hypothetical protein EKO05_0003952 [Ascochyta rabiei]
MGFRLSTTVVRLTPLRLLCAAVLLCVLYASSALPDLAPYGRRGYDDDGQARPEQVTMRFGEECSPFSAGAMEDVTVVVKTGAGEAATELPAYLNRLGRCKQDLLLFSDRKASVQGFDLVDALSHLRPEYRWANADFDVYDSIQAANHTPAKAPDGRKLDKYKFLPMMEWTAYLRPDSHWYLFIETDTYVNYDNLYRFLARFNPASAHYFGSPVRPKKKAPFAHAGSGFVLSRAALSKLMARGRMFAENHHFPGTHFFGEKAADSCCGDELLAQVLKKSGVPLRGYWPMFNADKPATIRFGPEQWCDAIVTMRHLHQHDFTALSQWEEARKHPERPLMFEELFTVVEPRLQDKAEDWSNMSDDVVHKKGVPIKSFEECERACLKDSKCMQFEHTGTECRLSHSIRLGEQRLSREDDKYVSGWMLDRIKAFKKANSPCQGAHFVHANP